MTAKYLQIQGKVQGVFFRKSAKELAFRLSISGWIKNGEEGDVQCVIQGDHQALETFISWCKKGPPGANVTNVIIHGFNNDKTLKKFEIVH